MYLAHTYRIDKWISTAFHQLLLIPLLEIDLSHVNQMGILAYYCLVDTSAKLQQFRKSIAAVSPPAVHDPGCLNHLRCARAWDQEWWNGLGRFILHPDLNPTANDATQELQNVASIPGMCNTCLRLTINSIFERDLFGKERAFIETGIAHLTTLITGRRK